VKNKAFRLKIGVLGQIKIEIVQTIIEFRMNFNCSASEEIIQAITNSDTIAGSTVINFQ